MAALAYKIMDAGAPVDRSPFAEVQRAISEPDGRPLLVAHLTSTACADMQLREEITALQRPAPQLVPVLTARWDAPQPVVVVPALDGRSLRRHLQQQGSFPVEDALILGIAALQGLLNYQQHTRRAGHGRVSLDHFILQDRELFTLAPALITLYGPDLFTRFPGEQTDPAAAEAYAYTPPEQLHPLATASAGGDVYSLGILIYQLITGMTPLAPTRGYSAVDPTAESGVVLQRAVGDGPVLTRLTRVLARATQWNAEERWADLAVFAEGLAQIQAATRPPAPGGHPTAIDTRTPPAAQPVSPGTGPSRSQPPRAVLKVLSTDLLYPVPEFETLIGRRDVTRPAPLDVDLADAPHGNFVSREHARLTYREDEHRWYVTALSSSTNKTYLNDLALPRGVPVPIHNGAIIRINDLRLLFEC